MHTWQRPDEVRPVYLQVNRDAPEFTPDLYLIFIDGVLVCQSIDAGRDNGAAMENIWQRSCCS
jgi:hypothetical protein